MKELNPFDKQNISDMMALTPVQEGLLFHYIKDPLGGFYNEQLSLELDGPLDVERFHQAWNRVVATNEMLRTVFRWEKIDNPAQLVLKSYPPAFSYRDLTSRRGGDSPAELRLEDIKRQDRNKSFDLRRVPFRLILCKIASERHVLLISNHHILYDGWSSGIILKEFFQVYEDLRENKKTVPLPKTKFKEFIRWIRSADRDAQKKYWQKYLADLENKTDIGVKNRADVQGVKNKEEGVTNHVTASLPEEIVKKTADFAAEYRLTPAALIYGAWGILLAKYGNCRDVVFGTTVSGRSATVKGIEECVGLFINTLPLRLRDKNGASVESLLRGIDRDLKTRQRFETSSLAEISGFTGGDNTAGLFDSIVVIENYPLHRRLRKNDGHRPQLVPGNFSMVESTHYDLTLSVAMFDGFSVDFGFLPGVFEKDVVEQLCRHFIRILTCCLDNPGLLPDDIDMMPDEEKKQVL
ncbi:MAG: non-ribosomal peptide synthetase, partial [bacterium]|nr:non-ribosomal peptide synthetase [bacterium]